MWSCLCHNNPIQKLKYPVLVFLLLTIQVIGTLLIPVHQAFALSTIATIPVGIGPLGVAVNTSTNRIYVANAGNGRVSVIDGATNMVLTTIITPISLSGGIAVNSSTNRIYATNSTGDIITVINGATNAVLTTVNVGALPIGVAVNSTTDRIYVTKNDDTVSVIDGATNSVIATIPVPGNLEDIAVNPGTNRIYVCNTNAVNVIDGITNTVIDTISTGAFIALSIAVNPSTNRIYVADLIGASVLVIDGVTNTLIGVPIIVGFSPDGVAVNTWTNTIYVANGADYSLSVINGATNVVTSTVNVGTNPAKVACNVNTGLVYVVNSGDNTVSVLGDAPAITSISPNSGTAGQSYTITISGSNFPAVSVTLNFGAGISVNNIVVNSNTQVTASITIDASAAAGLRNVTVTTPGGSATLPNAITVQAAPVAPTTTPISPPRRLFLEDSASPSMSLGNPANIGVKNVNVTQTPVAANQPVVIYSNLSNSGDMAGAFTANLKINGQVEQTKSVTVNGNAGAQVAFSVSKEYPGRYEVDVNGHQASFTVVKTGGNNPVNSSTGAAYGFIALFIVACFVLGIILVRRQQI